MNISLLATRNRIAIAAVMTAIRRRHAWRHLGLIVRGFLPRWER